MFSVGSFIIQGRGSTFTDSINHKDPCSTNVVFIEKNFAYQWTCTVQTYVILGIIIFNWISLLAQMVKKLPAMQETGFIPGLGRSSGERNGNPLQYSCPENFLDRGSRWATVHGVAKSWM